MGVVIHNQKQSGRDHQGDQGEGPIEVEHDQHHADERQHVDDQAEQDVRDQALDCIDVGRDAANQIAGAFMIVKGKRESLNVTVEHPPQVMHHPLANAGGQVLFTIGAERTDDRYHEHAEDRKVENGKLISADVANDPGEPVRHSL